MAAETKPARSVRVSDLVWTAARKRAAKDRTTISRVLELFVEGYARGLIDPPRVQVIYPPARQDQGTGTEGLPVGVPNPERS